MIELVAFATTDGTGTTHIARKPRRPPRRVKLAEPVATNSLHPLPYDVINERHRIGWPLAAVVRLSAALLTTLGDRVLSACMVRFRCLLGACLFAAIAVAAALCAPRNAAATCGDYVLALGENPMHHHSEAATSVYRPTDAADTSLLPRPGLLHQPSLLRQSSVLHEAGLPYGTSRLPPVSSPGSPNSPCRGPQCGKAPPVTAPLPISTAEANLGRLVWNTVKAELPAPPQGCAPWYGAAPLLYAFEAPSGVFHPPRA